MGRVGSRLRAKRLLLNVPILLASLAFSLFIVEGLLRLSHTPDLCCRYDPLFGWSKRPSSKMRNVTGEYEITEDFNSKGLRGPEYSYEKAADEYRILVLGDSFAEGFTVEFGELFSEVLKRKLNDTGNRQYEIINAGTRGYSTVQELLYFEHEGKKYRPDLTVLMFYDNDIWDNTQPMARGKFKPYYKLENDVPTLMNFPAPPPDSREKDVSVKNRRGAQNSAFKKVKGWLKAHSYLYRFVRDKVMNVEYLYDLAKRFGLATSPVRNPAFGIWRKSYSPETRDAWKVTEAALVDLRDEVRAGKGTFLLFYIPYKYVIYEDAWEALKKRFGFSDEEWDPGRVVVELDALCKRQGFSCINPVKLFKAREREIKKTGSRLYLAKDPHWTVKGNEYVGEILATYISSNFIESNNERAKKAEE